EIKPVARFIRVVPGRAAVEYIVAALVLPTPRSLQAVEDRHQRCSAIDHGRIDDIPAPARARVDDSCEKTDGEIKRAAAIIADQIERRHRLFGSPAHPCGG